MCMRMQRSKVDIRTIFNIYYTLFIEAGPLSQTQNVSIWLVLLASFFCESTVSALQGWKYKQATMTAH